MSFVPQNNLERSLMRASAEPPHRPQFYRDLLESDLFIIQEGTPPVESGAKILQADERLQVQNIEWEGEPHLPVFSSLPRLQAVLTREAGYLALNAATLMEITQGADLILNPGSAYGKVLTKEEISRLLSGGMWAPERRVVKQAAQVLLGEPARYPSSLVNALKAHFKTIPEVEKAYLAHFHDPSQGEKGHTLVALEVNGDWDKATSDVGAVIGSVEIPDPPVDLIQIRGQDGFGEYFTRSSRPFYRRKRFGIF